MTPSCPMVFKRILTFTLCMRCSEQNVAILPGSRNAYVCMTSLPLVALTCTGMMERKQRSLLGPCKSEEELMM